MMKRILSTSAMALVMNSSWALAEPARSELSPAVVAQDPYDPAPVVTPPWVIAQLVPSPGVAVGQSGFHGTMTWQLTPVLFSFGTDSRLNRFRFFVVEPLYRQAGSIELFASPEYLGRPGGFERRVGTRTGARVYFPLLHRGEALSFSLGASAHLFADAVGPSFDAGLYTLFGGIGILGTVSPWFDDNYAQLALRLRWF